MVGKFFNTNSPVVSAGRLSLVTKALFAMLLCCKPPEEFSNIPRIEFESITYKEFTANPSSSVADSLIIRFKFQDGDGDIGLNRDENTYPYHDFELVTDKDFRFVTLGDRDLKLPLKSVFSGISTSYRDFTGGDKRPPYSCDNYLIGRINPERTFFSNDGKLTDLTEGTGYFDPLTDSHAKLSFFYTADNQFRARIPINTLVKDTVYIRRNDFNKNIFVEFLRKRGEGSYEEIDWKRVFDNFGCGDDYNARFPVFDAKNIGSSLEGTIKYSMVSFGGFRSIMRTDFFKLRVYIYDRSFNKSNVIESGDFTLDDLM